MHNGIINTLSSVGQEQSYFGLKNLNTKYYTFFNNDVTTPLIISNDIDIIQPDYLVIELAQTSNNIPYIKQQLKETIITIEFGDLHILSLPLNFLMNLNEPEIYNNKIYINLCFNMFFDDICIYILKNIHNSVKFYLQDHYNSNLSNIILNYGLICKVSFVSIEDKNIFKTYTSNIQNLSYINIMASINNINTTTNMFKFPIPFCGCSKGFFIESENIDQINSIQLLIDNDNIFTLNNFLIKKKCKIINDKMIYVAFNYGKSFIDRDYDTYDGAINLSDNINYQIEIMFDTACNNIKVYGLSINIYSNTQFIFNNTSLPSVQYTDLQILNSKLLNI